MIRNDEHKYIFVSTMKCGTHAVYAMLKSLGGRRVGGFHDNNPALIPEGYFLFTVCRNPFTRAVSLWQNTCIKHDRYRFRRFLEDYTDFTQFTDLLVRWKRKEVSAGHVLMVNQIHWHGHLTFDKILKLETLQSDFNSLPFITESTPLPRLNVGGYGDYKQHYTPEAVGNILEWAADDFKKLSYMEELL